MAACDAKTTKKLVKGKFARANKLGASSRQQVPTLGRLKKVLTWGKRRNPSCIIVMLHGLNDTPKSCAGSAAARWAASIKGALVVAPQAPDRCIWSDPKDPGFDWLRQRGTHDTTDHLANSRELVRAARCRARHLEAWLRALLRRHALRQDRLILVGFSQGCIPAVMCATRLRARGVAVLGGVPIQPIFSQRHGRYVGEQWMHWEELLPRSAPPTKFCAINGTKDCFVPRKKVEHLLAPFDCHWHWERGAGHDFPDRWYREAFRWMRALLS